MIDFQRVNVWYKNSFGWVSGWVSGWILWGIIAPRPAGPYPDISLAGKNPMSVALTERHHKSQDIYLLGTNLFSRLRHLKHLTGHGSENRNFLGFNRLFANSRDVAPLPCRNYANPPLKRLCVITVKLAAIGQRGVAEDEIKGRHLETSKMKTLKNVKNVSVEYFHCCGLSTSNALLNTCHVTS